MPKRRESPSYRFYALYDKVYRTDVLEWAYVRCRANDGAPGVDGQTFEDIEAYGLERWLDELATELRSEDVSTATGATRVHPERRMASNARWGSECPPRTTPSSQPPSGFVTITHPHHPLRGQRVEIVRLRRGIDPDLIVRLPDGRHAAIALSGTDYLAPPEDHSLLPPDHLLDLNGLRQVLQFLDRITRDGRREPGQGHHTPSSRSDSR